MPLITSRPAPSITRPASKKVPWVLVEEIALPASSRMTICEADVLGHAGLQTEAMAAGANERTAPLSMSARVWAADSPDETPGWGD